MNYTASVPKSGEGAGLWLLKIVSGLLLVIILAVHFIVNHMLGSQAGLLTYEEVVLYYAKNLIIPFMEILFVTFVVTHALLGVRSILLDLKPKPATMKVINWGFLVVGLGFVIYGIWLIVVIVQRGMSV